MATKVVDAQEDPLDLLAIEPANAIKFLNDTEAKLIKLPIEEKFAGRFVHSTCGPKFLVRRRTD